MITSAGQADFKILIIDDEEDFAASLAKLLVSNGYGCTYTIDPETVESLLQKESFSLILMDVRMPKIGGMDLLKKVRIANPLIPIIMMTGYPSIENAILAMKYGALNFFVKPFKLNILLEEIRKAATSSKDRLLEESLVTENEIITADSTLKSIIQNIKKAAPTMAPVLIQGESGTGKELVANLLHLQSDRSQKPFIKVNCAAIPDALLETELFGHEKGAFTDAIASRTGKFELASGGTIFLDEIGDMSLATQAKILRVLQEKEFQKVGGNKTLKADVRVISASNRNIEELSYEGKFRHDLYYRLSVITISLPPLRERNGDIPFLTNYFLRHYNKIYGKKIISVSPEVMIKFQGHSWPGNIRELKNCIERAVIFCDGEVLQLENLSSQYCQKMQEKPKTSPRGFGELYDNLSRDMITEALVQFSGNKQKTSEYLNISRKTLYNKMRKLGL